MLNRTGLRIGLAAVGLCLIAFPAGGPLLAASSELEDKEERESSLQGLTLLMDGDPDAAIAVFREIQSRDPQSPLGYLLEGNALWWKIYYATADLIDPDVFDVVSSETTPYDSHFEDLVRIAVSKSYARLAKHEDEARTYLYLGLAYALRARLAGLRGKDLPTARAGKKMRSFMLTAVRRDPNMTDAYLGLGLYNYFVDTLPTIVKLLRFLIALPGGSREVGLQQLRQAAEHGELTRGEAKFLLAKDYSRRNEMQYAKSLEFFQELAREYPHNPLWTLLAGSVCCRLKRTQECEASYRMVFEQTAGETLESKRAIHAAAVLALQRLHPGQKIE